jgi:hypothetical protein
MINISSVDSFMSHLRQIKPNGSQPLDQVFNQVINENTSSLKDNKLLIIILTDGEHYNTNFRKSLLNRKPLNKIFVNIVICTDKIETVNYMNKWDREIFNLDVIDDFNSERKEIKRKKGLNHSFSYGDYVAKCMIGSIDLKMDRLDEKYQECVVA